MAKKKVEGTLMRHENSFVIFDLETGGVDYKQNPLCEIGAVALNWHLEDLPDYQFLRLIKPYDDKLIYTPKALEINGLSMDDLSKGDDFEDVIKDFAKYLESFTKLTGKKKPILVGHNIKSFDIPFLTHCFERVGLDFSKYFEDFVDTLVWARMRSTNVQNFKLGTVCRAHNIQIMDAHSAYGDILANKELFKCFMKSFRGEGGQLANQPQERFREKFQF